MEILKLNQKTFDEVVIGNEKTVLVDFWAEWCGPCKMLAPVLEELAKRNPDIIIGKVNVDEEPELARRFNVMSIPYVIVYKPGEVPVKSVGYKTVDQLEELIF